MRLGVSGRLVGPVGRPCLSPPPCSAHSIDVYPPSGGIISETPLTAVDGWTAALVAKMSSAWVTTAEQLVGIAATAGGLASLAELLEADQDQVRRLVDAAEAVLPESSRRELAAPDDPSARGLGVLPPED